MAAGESITIQKLDETGAWADYYKARLIQANKTRSRETAQAGGEQGYEHVTFRLRWSRQLAAIEFDKPSYRLVWRGNAFDVREYDDYMYQHKTVDVRCVSYGDLVLHD